MVYSCKNKIKDMICIRYMAYIDNLFMLYEFLWPVNFSNCFSVGCWETHFVKSLHETCGICIPLSSMFPLGVHFPPFLLGGHPLKFFNGNQTRKPHIFLQFCHHDYFKEIYFFVQDILLLKSMLLRIHLCCWHDRQRLSSKWHTTYVT